MYIGIRLPFVQSDGGEAVLELARLAEDAGMHSVWVGDHIAFPVTPTESVNPTSKDGRYPRPAEIPQLDAWTTLAFAAGVTTKLQFGTRVTIAGYRHPLLFGKALATLDYLTGGRVICGLGLGWLREEFENLGIPYADRRVRLEEMIESLRVLWSASEPEYHGRCFDFNPVHFDPKPVREIPILLSGHSAPALERAVQISDGWIASKLTPSQMSVIGSDLRRRRADTARAHQPFTVAVTRAVAVDGDPEATWYEAGFVSLRELKEEIWRYADAGVDILILDTHRQIMADLVKVIELAMSTSAVT